MNKSPHLLRAERYRQLYKELRDFSNDVEQALNVYLRSPTRDNKIALNKAHDLMNRANVALIEKYNALKISDIHASQKV